MKDLSLTTLSLLTIVFITLKLTDVITWSWWWVLSPTIAEFAIYVAMIVSAIVTYLSAKRKIKKSNPDGKSRYQMRVEEMQERLNQQKNN